MLRTKLTSKGQITIPIAVRRKLNLQPGDEILFELGQDGEVKIRTLKRKRLTEFYASLPAETPYPGKTEIRKAVVTELAQHILNKEKGM